MNEETRKKIIDWIFENHSHHEQHDYGVYENGDEDYGCFDGEYPYVNSLELEKFIKSL